MKLIATILFLAGCANPGPQYQINELREQIRTANEAIETIKERLADVQADLAIYESTPIQCTCMGDEVMK